MKKEAREEILNLRGRKLVVILRKREKMGGL